MEGGDGTLNGSKSLPSGRGQSLVPFRVVLWSILKSLDTLDLCREKRESHVLQQLADNFVQSQFYYDPFSCGALFLQESWRSEAIGRTQYVNRATILNDLITVYDDMDRAVEQLVVQRNNLLLNIINQVDRHPTEQRTVRGQTTRRRSSLVLGGAEQDVVYPIPAGATPPVVGSMIFENTGGRIKTKMVHDDPCYHWMDHDVLSENVSELITAYKKELDLKKRIVHCLLYNIEVNNLDEFERCIQLVTSSPHIYQLVHTGQLHNFKEWLRTQIAAAPQRP